MYLPIVAQMNILRYVLPIALFKGALLSGQSFLVNLKKNAVSQHVVVSTVT